jgi:hypothetical protein
VRGFSSTARLFTQVGDVEIHPVSVDVRRTVPGSVEPYGAGEDLSRTLYEGGEQHELLGTQLYPLLCTSHDMADRIERHVPDPRYESAVFSAE